jgi:hypothetical protein
MIIKTDQKIVTKRWLNKLEALGLEKLKLTDDELVPVLQPPKLIIAEESEGKYLTYSLFSSYAELYRYINCYRKETGSSPSLYEVCPHYMKMHFDIDLPTKDLDMEIVRAKERIILHPILLSFKDVLEKHFPGKFCDKTFVDSLVITQSHTAEKISYHLVLDNYFFTNTECKIMYMETKDHLIKSHHLLQSSCIDQSVYKSNQNFRVYGCCKKNKRNVKGGYEGPDLEFGLEKYSHQRLVNRLRNKYEQEETTTPINMKILAASLLSNVITSIRLTFPETNVEKYVTRSEFKKITTSDTSMFDVFLRHPLSRSANGDPAFEISCSLTGGILVLNRVSPSECSLCKRIHDEENIYLKTEMNNDVFYYCRRAQDEKRDPYKIYIGNTISLE